MTVKSSAPASQTTSELARPPAAPAANGRQASLGTLFISAPRTRDDIGYCLIGTVVQHIAGKTDLLALNATVEAARAGEAGKGLPSLPAR